MKQNQVFHRAGEDTVNQKIYGFQGSFKNVGKMKQNQQFHRAGKDTVNCWQEARLP